MPYSVLIVDDEPMIRFGLSSCVDWPAEGFELIGDCANGEAALEVIERRGVDILITDIKMPKMDGLELTRRAKRLAPHVKVVLVSSFSDFEFAREAVKLGVIVDYLLKPTMEPEDLQRIVRGCKEALDADVDRARQSERRMDEESRQRRQRLELELKNVLSGSAEELQHRPDWMAGAVRVAVWRGTAADRSAPKTGTLPIAGMLRSESAKEQLNDRCPHGIAFVSGETELTMVIADRGGNGMPDIEALRSRLQEEGPAFTVGVSPPVRELRSLREAYGWANAAADRSFFEGAGRCYEGSIPPSPAILRQKEEELAKAGADWKNRLTAALASFDRNRCAAALEDVFSFWSGSRPPRPAIVAQARAMLAALWSTRFEWKTDERMKRWIEHLRLLDQAETLGDVVGLLRAEWTRLDEPSGLPLPAVDAAGVHVIQMALSYIQEHYREDLTLQQVADFVHMSKNYFSEQFKRHTGCNFIDFVIRLRIHYAKHLLDTTGLKVLEIGYQSGFHSPKHFLKLFKRLEGMTPAEYRETCRGRPPGEPVSTQGRTSHDGNA
ncbi:response regulator [Paenibacillaceae bacterium WGS1546]|uniref:response regulator n=1 Tax=Cohnella sp. WGS1546 TaxID=3366810 RepID=UPI00372CFCBD